MTARIYIVQGTYGTAGSFLHETMFSDDSPSLVAIDLFNGQYDTGIVERILRFDPVSLQVVDVSAEVLMLYAELCAERDEDPDERLEPIMRAYKVPANPNIAAVEDALVAIHRPRPAMEVRL